MRDDSTPFSVWLRAEVKRRGWSNAEFARRLGVRPGVSDRWIKGMQAPKPEFVQRMVTVLGYPFDYLMHRAHGTPLNEGSADAELAQRAREVQEQQARLEAAMAAFQQVVRDPHARQVKIIGAVPARVGARRCTEEWGMTRVPEDDLAGVRVPGAYVVQDDSMRGREVGVHRGDTVIVECQMDREPRQNELVIVRVGGERLFRRWRLNGDRATHLLDGDGTDTRTISAMDDYAVEGFYVTFKPTGAR